MPNKEKEICCKLFDLQKWIPEFCIDDAKRTALCFRESLMICLKNEFTTDTKPVGGYCILVEPIGPKGREFLIHVQSSMSTDGHFGGSKVISSATEQFHCLEEKRTEFVYRNGGLHEKTIFIGIDGDSYHVKLKRACPCKNLEESDDLSICCNHRFISEGINLLLMRYLALINYQGTLSLESITIDGDVTTCDYNCNASEQMELDDHFLSAYTIERRIHKQDGSVQDIKSYLTPQGKLIRHDWKEVPYVLKMNPLADAKVISEPTEIGTRLRDRWSEDIEMFSQYLDMKSSKMAEYTEYLADHPEIKHMIADYTQTLLIVKPVNVIDFTIQHFKAFAKEPKVWETSESDEEIKSDFFLQLPKEKPDLLCGICGFCINDQTSSEHSTKSSAEKTPEIMTPENSKCSSISQSSDSPVSSAEASMSIGGKENDFNSYHILPQLKKVCQSTGQPHLECPQCLKLNLNSIRTSLSNSKIEISNRSNQNGND